MNRPLRVRVPLCLVLFMVLCAKAIAVSPSLIRRCGSLLRAGHPLTAKTLLDEAISQNSPSLWNLRAEACYRLGHYEEAVLSLRQALLLSPNSLSARLRLGKVLAAAGDIGAARVQYEIVLANNELCGLARLALGRLYAADGEDKRAFKTMIPLMRKGRYKSQARLEGAIILARHNRFKKAKRLLRSLVLFGEDRAKAAYTAGLIADKEGDLPSAIHAYEEAVITCPTFPAAWNNLAIACEKVKMVEKAERAYRAGLSSSPQDLRLSHNFAEFLIKEHRADEAIGLLAGTEAEKNPAVLSTLGIAYGMKGDDTKAACLFTKSLQGRPNHGPTLYNLAVSKFNQGLNSAAYTLLCYADKAGYDVSPLRAQLGASNREGIAGHGKKTRTTVH